jgi:AmmeMemoRadiSam system protein A
MTNLEREQKLILLRLARQAIERWVGQGARTIEATGDPALLELAGAFVTLHREGELRGCIGRIRADLPLERVIQEVAISAATGDPRFAPVKHAEISEIDLEISVISPFEEVQDITEIEIGRHGLMVSETYVSGLLLPQVASEYGWDARTFLEHTCLKAGLPKDHWEKAKPKIEKFSAEVFSEKGLGVR